MLKNKFPKKYYILAAVLVVAIFIVTGYILAADDNANQPSCSSDIWNCDNSSSACQSIAGFDWTSNGYSGGAGNPECCGDDSQETYRTCGTDLNIAWSCSADACCPSYTYCVDKNSNCKYAGLTAAIPYSNLNPGSNDNTAVCRGGGWEDCDFEWPGQGYYCGGEGDLCGETVVSGESGVGEYEFAGQTACCGDDSQEVYNECYTTSDVEWRGGIASPISYTCASTASACCSSDKCVGPNGNCYSQGLPIQFYSSGNDQSVLCYVWGGSPFTTTGWGDCDYNDCGPSVCIGSHGVTPGETGVGEYDINSDITGECCGDDTNEYYITDFCPGYSGPGKCCNNANDKIDASGNCVSSCDNEDPTVDAFSVNGNTNDFNTCDTSLDIAWTVSDTGGSGLNRVEVWRKTDGGAWTEVHQESLSGNGPVSGSWTDNVSCSGDHHTYEYGIHVIDNADNMGTEDSTITATLVCTPNAVSYSSFSTCPQPPPGGNDICFTNIESIGMRLRWNDNSNNEDGFYIYRDNPTKLVWTNNPNDDSKKFLDLACNTEYTYWVSAFNTYAGLTCESDKKDGSERTLGCGPDFGIQVEPGSQSINYINTAYYIVTLTSYNNFDDDVDLSASMGFCLL